MARIGGIPSRSDRSGANPRVGGKQATRDFSRDGSPRRSGQLGIVLNLARPDGNSTGFDAQNVDLDGKRAEVRKDLLRIFPA